jgi:ribose transport system substrate-binding protein
VLFVHGYPGSSADTGEFNGVKEVLANCPGVKLEGEVIGGYENSAAKSETLKFLATHPQAPDIVVHAGGMGTGVLGAYGSSGKPVPALGDIGAVQGSLNYWNNHKDTFQAMGFGQPAKWTASAIVSIALRTLQGQGPKVNTVAPPVPLITGDNLDQWVDPKAGESSEAAADGPRDAFLSEDYLNGLFNDGKDPQAK